MKVLSAIIYALLLLFARLGSFFVAPVELGQGERENFPPLQASLRELTGDGLKKAKLNVESRVSPLEGLDRSLVSLQQYADQSAEVRSLTDSDSV